MLILLIRINFLVFSIETILGGPGTWLTFFGVSVRKIFFVVLLAQLITYAAVYKPRLISRNFVTWLLFLVFFVIWGLVIPASYNRDISLSFADFSPLFGLCIIPGLASVYECPHAWRKDKRLLLGALSCLALLHISIWILATISVDYGNAIVQSMRHVLEPNVAEGESLLYLGYTPSGVFRSQWGSSIFLVLGLYFACEKVISHRLTKFSIAILVMQLVAILTTQSRGIVLSIVLALMLYTFGKKFFPKKIQSGHIFACIISLFLLTFILVPFYSPEFLSAIGMDREGSDDERAAQLIPIFKRIIDYPLLGIGFGGSADIIRSEQAPYAYEVSMLALYMKLGFLGMIWVVVLTVCLVYFLLNGVKINNLYKKAFSLLYATFFAFVFMSNSNPYFSNFFGMLIITILFIEFRFLGLLDTTKEQNAHS
jgi:hypothetical protein